jgi:hypothetical protein
MISTLPNTAQNAGNGNHVPVVQTTAQRYRELLKDSPQTALELAIAENERAKTRLAESKQVQIDAQGRFLARTLEALQAVGAWLASTTLVPERFQGRPADCAVGVHLAQLLKLSPVMVLQNCYVVHGRPGIEAKLAIAVLNTSGEIRDVIRYEHEGEGPDRKCRAWVSLESGTRVEGPWVRWSTVESEGWNRPRKAKGKQDQEYVQKSKWETMPELMFEYRSAAWLIRTRFPHLIFGMQTREELEDVHGVALDEPDRTSDTGDPPRIVETGADLQISGARSAEPPAQAEGPVRERAGERSRTTQQKSAPAALSDQSDQSDVSDEETLPEGKEMPDSADVPEPLRAPASPTAEPEHPPTIPAGAPVADSSSAERPLPAPAATRAPQPAATREPGDESPEDTALDMAAVMRDRMNRCRTVSGLSRLLDIVDEMAADLGDQAPVIRDEIRNRQQALRPSTTH